MRTREGPQPQPISKVSDEALLLITDYSPPHKKKRANPQRASSPTEHVSTHQLLSGTSRPNIENGIARALGAAAGGVSALRCCSAIRRSIISAICCADGRSACLSTASAQQRSARHQHLNTGKRKLRVPGSHSHPYLQCFLPGWNVLSPYSSPLLSRHSTTDLEGAAPFEFFPNSSPSRAFCGMNGGLLRSYAASPLLFLLSFLRTEYTVQTPFVNCGASR
jgi:hypothetical protein